MIDERAKAKRSMLDAPPASTPPESGWTGGMGSFAVVVLVAHAGDPLGDRELPILFLTIAVALAFTGPGRYSLDAMIRGRRAGGQGETRS